MKRWAQEEGGWLGEVWGATTGVRGLVLQGVDKSSWASAGSAAEEKRDPAAGTLLRAGVRTWRISSIWVSPERKQET